MTNRTDTSLKQALKLIEHTVYIEDEYIYKSSAHINHR